MYTNNLFFMWGGCLEFRVQACKHATTENRCCVFHFIRVVFVHASIDWCKPFEHATTKIRQCAALGETTKIQAFISHTISCDSADHNFNNVWFRRPKLLEMPPTTISISADPAWWDSADRNLHLVQQHDRYYGIANENWRHAMRTRSKEINWRSFPEHRMICLWIDILLWHMNGVVCSVYFA